MMKPLLFTLIALCLSVNDVNAANGCAAQQQETIKNYIFRIVPTLTTFTHSQVQAWGGGGGNRQMIPSNSGSPFAGREFGGGDRHAIYGTRAYGSGYPYGAGNDSSTIAHRPFPYGTWPISFGAFLGGQEYLGPTVDAVRPGGPLASIKVGSNDTSKYPGITSAEVYEMVGDKDSIVFMMADLVNWCHASPAWPVAFDPAAAGAVKPENVIQYYRASSFALAYSAYNNTFVHNSPSTSQTFEQSSPLPSNISSSAFLQCVNSTIGAALPIVDAPPKKFPTYAIVLLSTLIPLGVVSFFALMIWSDKKRIQRLAEQQNVPAPIQAEASSDKATIPQ